MASLNRGRLCAILFVANLDELIPSISPKGVDHRVQRVAAYSVTAAYARGMKQLPHHICNICHGEDPFACQ